LTIKKLPSQNYYPLKINKNIQPKLWKLKTR
jgi:hypothetical protein